MDYSSKLTQLLQQLEVETGITFTVADSTLDEAETLAKVRDFLSFYQTRDNRNLFLSRFFLGQLSPEEILRGKQRFHIEESTLRVLFLLDCKQPYDPAVISVLSNLNASGADMIVELDSLHIAVIRQLKHSLSDQALRKAALGLVDTLEAETMVSFAVAYDSCCEAFSQLPVSYQNCHAALRIGNIFYSSERVFGYRELGLGKLLYYVPREVCYHYLEDNFGSLDYRDLDDETLHIIHTFFDSGLSIAETARKLYMHRNTLVYRLDKIQKLTGLDIRRFEDAVTCKIGLMLGIFLYRDQESRPAPDPMSTT